MTLDPLTTCLWSEPRFRFVDPLGPIGSVAVMLLLVIAQVRLSGPSVARQRRGFHRALTTVRIHPPTRRGPRT